MSRKILNFGRNVAFSPKAYLRPRTEDELLEQLRRNQVWPLRCHGSRHAWSPLIQTEGSLVSVEHFQQMKIVDVDGAKRIRVGAGCKVKQLVRFLNKHKLTLPSLGLIDEQTVAGATATGTHGSGNHSLSHFVQAVRLVRFNKDEKDWKADWIREGNALRAARCSLGALGLVTELEFPVRPQYRIEEHFAVYHSLEPVLAGEEEFPLQQFFYLPWRWDFFVQHRRETEAQRSWLAPMYRIFWLAGMDFGLHLLVCSLGKWLPWGAGKWTYRRFITSLIPRGWRVVDRSDKQLTMQHDLFRHIEIELFVPRPKLPEMLGLVRQHLETCAAKPQRTRYEHHYPICIRKILNDETMISPASGGFEPWYSVSLISYNRVNARAGFHEFANDLAHESATRLGARPHWGKVCPLDGKHLEQLYDELPVFRRLIQEFDEEKHFQNCWLAERFSLAPIDSGSDAENLVDAGQAPC